MQPPPPPLNIAQLKMLIAQADLIVVGKVTEVKETAGTIEVALSIEKLLKGKVAGKTVAIKEACQPVTTRLPDVDSKDKGEPSKMVVANRAGPSFYHGRYNPGMRIVVLLEKIKDSDKYRPLGSGTYNKHLGEFLIENDGIKTFYFKFAEDVGKYAGCEKQFISIIKELIKANSNIGEK